jgi:hypothetical protein
VARGVRRALLAAAVLAAGALAEPASAGGGTTSAEVPNRRDVTSAVILTSTADALVQVNVDIGMPVKAGRRCTSRLPGVCKGRVYHPCFNLNDPVFPGCQLYTLYQVLDSGAPLKLSEGITIGNSSSARDGSIVHHNWARKVMQADLEFYAFDPLGRYGDVRMRVPAFPVIDKGVAYSDPIGHIPLPMLGAPDVGRLVGTAVGEDGQPMPPGSFKLDLFGHTGTGHKTGLLGDKAFTVYGFGGAKIRPGTTDGSFASKPAWAGAYDVHVQRKGASFRCAFDIAPGLPSRFDIDFSKPNLGQPRCQPMRSLAQGVPG